MKTKEDVLKKAHKLAKPFRITDEEKFQLTEVDPGYTLGFKSAAKPRSKEALANGIEALAEMQDKPYAQG